MLFHSAPWPGRPQQMTCRSLYYGHTINAPSPNEWLSFYGDGQLGSIHHDDGVCVHTHTQSTHPYDKAALYEVPSKFWSVVYPWCWLAAAESRRVKGGKIWNRETGQNLLGPYIHLFMYICTHDSNSILLPSPNSLPIFLFSYFLLWTRKRNDRKKTPHRNHSFPEDCGRREYYRVYIYLFSGWRRSGLFSIFLFTKWKLISIAFLCGDSAFRLSLLRRCSPLPPSRKRPPVDRRTEGSA